MRWMHCNLAPSALSKRKLYLSPIEVVKRRKGKERKEKKRKAQSAFDNGYIQVLREPSAGQPPNWKKEGVNATFSYLISEWEMAKTHPAMAKTKAGRHDRKRLLLFEGKIGHLDYFRKGKPRPWRPWSLGLRNCSLALWNINNPRDPALTAMSSSWGPHCPRW